MSDGRSSTARPRNEPGDPDPTTLLAALEQRIERVMAVLAHLKSENARLTVELEQTHARLTELDTTRGRWEKERTTLGSRIERLLVELDTFSAPDNPGTRVP